MKNEGVAIQFPVQHMNDMANAMLWVSPLGGDLHGLINFSPWNKHIIKHCSSFKVYPEFTLPNSGRVSLCFVCD